MISIYLDHKIKERFKLFEKPENKSKDQRIYTEIYGLLHDEIIRFVEDYLKEEDFKVLLNQIAAIEKKEANPVDRFPQVYPLIIKSLMNIPNYEYRLYKRLDYFLSNLYFDSLKPRANSKKK